MSKISTNVYVHGSYHVHTWFSRAQTCLYVPLVLDTRCYPSFPTAQFRGPYAECCAPFQNSKDYPHPHPPLPKWEEGDHSVLHLYVGHEKLLGQLVCEWTGLVCTMYILCTYMFISCIYMFIHICSEFCIYHYIISPLNRSRHSISHAIAHRMAIWYIHGKLVYEQCI